MSTITIILIAFGLSLDALAVAIAASVVLRTITGRHIFRLGFHFGLFQALMPIIGWLAGSRLQPYIAGWDHWLAFGLLTFVGLKAIREAFAGEEFRTPRGDPTRGVSLVVLSVATSIDALAVGVTFAALRVEIWYPSVIIGCITGALTTLGMLIGGRLGARFGKRLEILGGLVLLAIGAKVLIAHAVGG